MGNGSSDLKEDMAQLLLCTLITVMCIDTNYVVCTIPYLSRGNYAQSGFIRRNSSLMLIFDLYSPCEHPI